MSTKDPDKYTGLKHKVPFFRNVFLFGLFMRPGVMGIWLIHSEYLVILA
ncbi:MAG TPA: hypothetical protein VIJ75_04395 [Hanamia sp.]